MTRLSSSQIRHGAQAIRGGEGLVAFDAKRPQVDGADPTSHSAPGDFESLVVSPVQSAISLIQGKWKPGILVRLEHGPARLGQLRRTFPSASTKMLVQHLRELEHDGFVVRIDLSRRVRHVEYSLAGAHGRAAAKLVATLADWGKRHAVISESGKCGE